MILIRLDKEIYSKEVLLRTAYTFTDRAYIHLSQENSYWLVEITPKEEEAFHAGEFENEMQQQELRTLLAEKNSEIRKLILARAYASTIIETEEELTKTDNILPSDENDDSSILKGWHEINDRV